MTRPLTREEDRLVRALHEAWQRRQKEAREAETRIRQAQTPEARAEAVDAAQRLLRRLSGQDRPGRPMAEGRAALKAEARRMRGEEGRSVRAIAEALGVARATVHVWVRDLAVGDVEPFPKATERKDRP